MTEKKSGFRSKIRYSFDNFMSKGGISVFIALMFLFISAIVIMSLIRFIVNIIDPQENMENIFKPEFFTPLSPEIQAILQNAVADSISTVFWIVFGTAILTLISSLLINEKSGKSL